MSEAINREKLLDYVSTAITEFIPEWQITEQGLEVYGDLLVPGTDKSTIVTTVADNKALINALGVEITILAESKDNAMGLLLTQIMGIEAFQNAFIDAFEGLSLEEA